MTQWRSDVLGDEFECTDIDLGEDSEGPLFATLVRALRDGGVEALRAEARALASGTAR